MKDLVGRFTIQYRKYLSRVLYLREFLPYKYIQIKAIKNNSIFDYICDNFGFHFAYIEQNNTINIGSEYPEYEYSDNSPSSVLYIDATNADISILKEVHTLQNDLINMIISNQKDFIDILNHYSDLYPSVEIDSRYVYLWKCIQFNTFDGKIRHFTAIKYNEAIYDFTIQSLYSTLENIIRFMISNNLVEYKYLTGYEDITDIFKLNKEDPGKKWKDISWSNDSLTRDILDNGGCYLPFIYYKDETENKDCLLDGIHRYEALKLINLYKTNMKVLALNTSQYDPNQSFKFIIYNIPSFIVYNEMLSEINFDGEDLEDGLCALCIYNISDLILLYNLISRELNNFIDDGKLKTKASSLINLIEREDNRNGTR